MKKTISICLVIVLALAIALVYGLKTAAVTVEDIQADLTDTPRELEDYAYSFAVVGDTQIVTYNDVYSNKQNLNKIYDWIVANKESKKIEFVFGLGDITDTNAPAEWAHAYNQISKLDGVVPYTVVRGNHDLPLRYGVPDDTTDYFSLYLGTDAYRDQFEDGGFYGEGVQNAWRTFSVGDVKYLIFTADHGMPDKVLNWMEEIIVAHPDHNVIITTHGYLKTGAELSTRDDTYDASKYTDECNSGVELWEKLFSKHENIVLVMAGHISSYSVDVKQLQGEKGNTVTNLMFNPQGMDAQLKTGAVAMLYFSEDGRQMQVECYSTVQEKYFKSGEQSYVIDVVGCDHEWDEATCTAPKTCSKCGETEGEALSHKWDDATCTLPKTCSECGETEGTALGHDWDDATCTLPKTCSECGETEGAALGHEWDDATCTAPKTCSECGETEGTKLGHSYVKTFAKATTSKNGHITYTCERCEYVASSSKVIYKISSVKLSATSYTYNGKVRTPSVTVKDSKGNTISSSNYTVTYENGRKNAGTYDVTVKFKGNYSGTKKLSFKINPISISKCTVKLSATSYTYSGSTRTPTVTVKNANGTKLTKGTHYTVKYASGRKSVGTYKVTVTMKGNYSGTKTLTFKIVPKATSISKLTAKTKALTVKLNKQTTQTSGYQIVYSTSKKFSSYKSTLITSNKTTTKTITGLKAGTTYYVKVRTYKTVNGTRIYSAWSSVKSIKTK